MSEERDLLRQTVAGLVDKHAGPEAVRRAMESDLGYDGSLWTLLCGGWLVAWLRGRLQR